MLIHINLAGEWDLYLDVKTRRMYTTAAQDRELTMPEDGFMLGWDDWFAFLEALGVETESRGIQRGKNNWTAINRFVRQHLWQLGEDYTERSPRLNLFSGTGKIKEGSWAEVVHTVDSTPAEEGRLLCPRVKISPREETWVWDTVEFGRYPKTEIREDDPIFLPLTSKNRFSADGLGEFDKELYFRLSYDQVKECAFWGTGHQEQAWAGKEYRYFKVEPILWRVLEGIRAGDKVQLLLLAENAVDCKAYHHVHDGVTWITSSFCHWLNAADWEPEEAVAKVFYTKPFYQAAFNDQERQKMVPFQDPAYLTYPMRGGKTGRTAHMVSLLTKSQAFDRVYGFLPKPEAAAKKNQIYTLTPTDYAVATGTDHLPEDLDGAHYESLCGWAIREQGETPSLVVGFNVSGTYAVQGYPVYKSGFEGGTRPVIQVRLTEAELAQCLRTTTSAVLKY